MAEKKRTKRRASTRRPVAKRPADVLPHGYAEFLDVLKARIRTAQVRAVFAVNRELVTLY